MPSLRSNSDEGTRIYLSLRTWFTFVAPGTVEAQNPSFQALDNLSVPLVLFRTPAKVQQRQCHSLTVALEIHTTQQIMIQDAL